MQDLTWLHCLVAVSGLLSNTTASANPAVADDEGDEVAALLLDRRLMKTKGRHLTSFFGGSVLAFLSNTSLFPDSTVLAAVPLDTLDAFTTLLHHALGYARRFKLLFRSSRDGASAASFHSHCDRKGLTLTLIRDVDNNVFGGYAGVSVEWGSAACGTWLKDPAAFLFTVANPHGDPPALFALKANGYSIFCYSSWGPAFGDDLYVSGAFDDRCWSGIGYAYVNATRHSGDTVLTGAWRFTPAEVEVWSLE